MSSQDIKIHSTKARQPLNYWIGILVVLLTHVVSSNRQQRLTTNQSSLPNIDLNAKEGDHLNSNGAQKIKYNCDHDDSSSEIKTKVCSQSKFKRELQLESIKQSILDRLNISNPYLPHSNFIEPDSATFVRVKQLVENEQQHQVDKKHKKVYVRPENSTHANEGNKRLTFKLRKDITERGIKQALLHIYVRKPINFDPTHPEPWLLVYHKLILIGRRRLDVTNANTVDKYLKIDLTQNIQDFLREREQVLKNQSSSSSSNSIDPRLDQYQLDIICLDREGNSMVVKTAHDADELYRMPFLEIHIRDVLLSRIKRGNRDDTCHSSSSDFNCCRYSLTIDFHELGWEWVIRPQKVKINYCSGNCQLMKLGYYQVTENYLGSAQAPGMKRCCSAKSFTPVSMLYKAEGNSTELTVLTSLVVDKCGCV